MAFSIALFISAIERCQRAQQMDTVKEDLRFRMPIRAVLIGRRRRHDKLEIGKKERYGKKENKCGRGTENGEKTATRHQIKRGKRQRVSHTNTEAIYRASSGERAKEGGDLKRKDVVSIYEMISEKGHNTYCSQFSNVGKLIRGLGIVLSV